jgi:hypothetical protein
MIYANFGAWKTMFFLFLSKITQNVPEKCRDQIPTQGTKKRRRVENCRKFLCFFAFYLRMSKKSSNFVADFVNYPHYGIKREYTNITCAGGRDEGNEC